MAATKNTLSALWGKKLQDDRKTKSGDHGSVISTRSRAPEDKGAQEKEATSRLSKPEGEQASGPTDPPGVGKIADADAQGKPQQEDLRKRKRGLENRDRLEEYFWSNQVPSAVQKAAIAEQSGLSIQQVSKWFEKRRKKARLANTGQDVNAAEAVVAQAAEPLVIDDDDDDALVIVEDPQCLEQPASADVAEAATCKPQEQAGPSQTPVAVSKKTREEQLAQIREEIRVLESHVTQSPSMIPLKKEGLEGALNRGQVASYLVGSSLPLSEVTAELWELGKGSPDLTEAAVRNMVIDLAARRSFGAKDAGSDKVDALEDKTGKFLWQWELREQKSLPKAHRAAAGQHKKHMQKIAARLTALAAACKALEAAGSGKGAEGKIQKALAKLEKVENPILSPTAAACSVPASLQVPPAVEAAQGNDPAGPSQDGPSATAAAVPAAETIGDASQEGTPAADAHTPAAAGKEATDEEKRKRSEEKAKLNADKERARLEREKAAEEKERARIEAAQEKERQRLEKEVQKREKEAEKERQRAAKEAEKEKQRAEKEAAKTGFHSQTALSKSRNLMNKFFKTPAKSAGEAGGAGSSQLPKTPLSAQPLRHPFHDLFTPAPERARLPIPRDISEEFDEAMAAAKQRPMEELVEGMQQILRSWKSKPRHRPIRGLPPSWARMRTPEEHLAEFGRLDKAKLWRRKFLWFTDSKRPAYYGSWSRASLTVKGRRPLAKDAELDYEVMSDEEWEEEPEGENLSDDDMEEEDTDMEDSCGDGFVVPNGYISEDEGVGSVQQDLDELCAELEDDAMGADMAAGGEAVQRDRLRLLNAALDRATRANRPIIISRLPAPALPSSQDSARTGHLTGDPALLCALQPLVLTTRVKIRMIPPPEADDAWGGGAADRGAEPATARGRGRPAAQDQEDLTSALVQFLLAHPELKAVAKVTQAFTEAHSERKVVKKWVHGKIKDIAEHSGGVWIIKQSAMSSAPAEATASPPQGQSQGPPAVTPPHPTPLHQQRPCSAGADLPRPTSQPAETPRAAAPTSQTPPVAGPLDRFVRTGSAPQTAAKPQAAPKPSAAQPTEVVVLDEDLDAPAPMDVDAAATTTPAASNPGNVHEIRGTADPFWKELREQLAQNSLEVAAQLPKAFGARAAAGEPACAVPSFIVTAMVKGLASGQFSRLLQSRVLEALCCIVRALAAAGDSVNCLPSPSKVFCDERSAPVAASLEEMLGSRSLLAALQTCMRAKQNRPPQLAQPAVQLLAAMLAVGSAEPGASGQQGGPAPTAVAVSAAAELRAHVAKDSAWLALFAELLGPGNDATIVACVADALVAIARDAAAAMALLRMHEDSSYTNSDAALDSAAIKKLRRAVSSIAKQPPSKVATQQCMNFLAALLSAEGAAEALLPTHRKDYVFLTDLQQAVKMHIPADADAAAVDERCMLPALEIAEFLVKDSTQSLAVMRGLSGTLAAHGGIWQKLQATDKVEKLLTLLNLPQ
ncbi:probable chromatin assembly factor 1 subunit FSM at N-terminal half [Coccomyxa sp. Obi]|nr:probable chromatin assembly factor 1 subunit FSM at N-terminal half [Coccomyxa sp. Obi]